MKKPNFFTRLFGKLKNWYEKAFSAFEDEGYAGVVATNWLKENFDNGTIDAIADFTPSEEDDELVTKAKANVLPALEVYAKAHNLAVEGKSKFEVVKLVFDYIASLGTKRSFWVEISGDVIVMLADGRISWNEALILGQKIFWQIFNKDRKLKIAA